MCKMEYIASDWSNINASWFAKAVQDSKSASKVYERKSELYKTKFKNPPKITAFNE